MQIAIISSTSAMGFCLLWHHKQQFSVRFSIHKFNNWILQKASELLQQPQASLPAPANSSMGKFMIICGLAKVARGKIDGAIGN